MSDDQIMCENEQLRALLYSFHDAVVEFDTDTGQVLKANETFSEIYGWKAEERCTLDSRIFKMFRETGGAGAGVRIFETESANLRGEILPVKVRICSDCGTRAFAVIHNLSEYTKTRERLDNDQWIFSFIDSFKQRLPKEGLDSVLKYCLNSLKPVFDFAYIIFYPIGVKQGVLYYPGDISIERIQVDPDHPFFLYCQNPGLMFTPGIWGEQFKGLIHEHRRYILPLSLRNRNVGSIYVGNSLQKEIPEYQIQLLKILSSLIIVVLENSSLFQELTTRELRYRALFEYAPDAILLFDFESMSFIDVNAKAIQLYQASAEEILAAPLGLFSIESQDKYDTIIDHFRKQIQTGGKKEYFIDRWNIQRKGGEVVPCEVRISYFPSEGRHQFRISIFDISARIEMENKLRIQQKQLIQSAHLAGLGRLSAGLAHEITQPLQAISLGVESILLDRKDRVSDVEEEQKKLGQISGYIRRIRELIENMRLFARGGQLSDSNEHFAVNQVVDDVASMLQAQFKGHGVTLEQEWPKEELLVSGNRYRIQQVFVNLFTNAIYAMNHKEEKLGSYKKKLSIKAQKKEQLILQVIDNGMGIPEGVLSTIFDPFFTSKTESEGTGLGLSITYNIIQEFGGSIDCESREAEWTCFTIRLPLESCSESSE